MSWEELAELSVVIAGLILIAVTIVFFKFLGRGEVGTKGEE